MIFVVIAAIPTPISAGNEWQAYPADLVQYHYKAETLDNQHEEYVQLLRQAWAYLFNGEFKQARDLGLALGPAGYFPGLYAQALYATLIETDPEYRKTLLEEVIARTDEILPMAPDHPMIRFGNTYGKARILENLSATEAMATGYTSDITGGLQELLDENPENIYAIVLYAGVQAGIIEKAGSFIGRVTYGARKSSIEELCQRAYEIAPGYPGLYYEHARSVQKLDEKSGTQQALEHLRAIASIGAVSAEDELIKHRADSLTHKLTR
ncbi:MAG: hypothetical protein HLUCCX14_07320 [Marinobacter excellens HL-55]|uniref:Uncharacterized protein n=1 Tax=Marinobacter excellens HL-55 TaxID=1305731 RepID=A0A0P7ZAD5_9GAMM|nr:MAG: hypothetical protein HLUCCX14_07320 [Marinobacter excellens HL-55]